MYNSQSTYTGDEKSDSALLPRLPISTARKMSATLGRESTAPICAPVGPLLQTVGPFGATHITVRATHLLGKLLSQKTCVTLLHTEESRAETGTWYQRMFSDNNVWRRVRKKLPKLSLTETYKGPKKYLLGRIKLTLMIPELIC
jgi:hypothetical protein